jgi:hypothetical protein
MKPSIILNVAGDRGKLKARIFSDKLLEVEITFQFKRAGECFTIAVDESKVRMALEL